MSRETLLLTGSDVRALLPPADCIRVVEAAFRSHAEGAALPAAVLGFALDRGGFHIKAAALRLERHYFAAKLNGNFPDNPARFGLPTIQGILALCDAETGALLALMDSMELTRVRTGAATALAARYLARGDSSSLTLFGCGSQSKAQLEALLVVLPLSRVYAYDTVPEAAAAFAGWAREAWGLDARAVDRGAARRSARASDVIVTCTPARRYFLTRDDVGPGCFVAAVGADDAGKQELEPALLASSVVVADVLAQGLAIGELHHAVDAGVLRPDLVHAELAELVAGLKPGRSDPRQITLFDSTGTALEDVAAAALAFERAVAAGRGIPMVLGTP